MTMTFVTITAMSILATLWRRREQRTGLPPVADGEHVWISLPDCEDRLPTRVAASGPGKLTLVLATTAPSSLRRRGRVKLDWIDGVSLVQARGRVIATSVGPPPVAEIRMMGRPEAIERREHLRVAADLDVSGWSLQDPTRLLAGKTIDVSDSGALLELPMVPETASTLDLRLTLPDGALAAMGHVVRRALDDLVAVRFEPKSPQEHERWAKFVAARLRNQGAARRSLP
jgi:hypothetical protein